MDDNRTRLPERHERKYWINKGDLALLREKLKQVMAYDSHTDENGEYFIRSLYFDDAYDRAYYDKLDGVQDRDKYRIRIYNMSDSVIFLERKRKVGELIQKTACRIDRKLADALADGDAACLLEYDEPLLTDMYVEMRTKLLRPRVLVDYVREAFVFPAEHTRVTFDKQLATCPGSTDMFDPELLTLSPLDDSKQILEVKFDTYLPDYIAHLLADTPTENCAISKYVLCRRFEPLA